MTGMDQRESKGGTMQVYDVRTRSSAAKAVMWDGTEQQAELIQEWVEALGEMRAVYYDGAGDGQQPASLRLMVGDVLTGEAFAGFWIVQMDDALHRVLGPTQYAEEFEQGMRVGVEITGMPEEFELPSVAELAARIDTGDNMVKGVVDLDLKYADSLTQAINLAVGAASMTWPHVGGVFDEEKARDIACQLEHEVRGRLQHHADETVVAESRKWVEVARQETERLREAKQRTIEVCQGVRDREGPMGQINATQVMKLLSLTYPDGNYESDVSDQQPNPRVEYLPVGTRIRAKITPWGAAINWPKVSTDDVVMQLSADKTWYADAADPAAPVTVTQLSYDNITVLEILRMGYGRQSPEAAALPPIDRPLARCPKCMVERADYQGPGGAWLTNCPNCSTTTEPIVLCRAETEGDFFTGNPESVLRCVKYGQHDVHTSAEGAFWS